MNTVQIYLGTDGIKQAYNESIAQQALAIVCLSDNYQHVIGDYYENRFAPKVYGKVKTREILPDTPENRESAATKDLNINAVRFLKKGISSESDMLLWDDRAIFITFGVTPMAVIICEPELVNSLGVQFETLWGKLA